MIKILIPILFSIFLFSCKEENNREEIYRLRQIEREQWEAKIDSVYLSLSEEYQSEKNWENFNYEYLFELQEYLESKNGKFTLKDFYDYEIYKKDFQLFKYDFENPANKMPIGEIDLDEVHAKLGD